MSLVQLQCVDFSVGGPLLLEHVDLSIEASERVCIVGRNGEGKSTLLKLISGELRADDGEVRVQNGIAIARLPQEVPQDTAGSVFDVVAEGLGDLGRLLARYQHLLTVGDVDALGDAQAQIEVQHGWDLNRRVEEVLTKLGLPGDADFSALSGGMKRRVLLAQALVRKPDILLLDEPTNHLDINAIRWLEGFLEQFAGSIVFITHDRTFLRALATRIVEIDRGALTDWPGDYDNYLRRREERLHGRVKRACRSRPCRTIKREGAKNLYGSTWIPETEWRGQSREVANDFCIVGAVQLVEAVAGHVDCALLKHDLSGRRDFENAIAKICAQVGILVMDAQRRETVRAWMPSRSRGFS
jgi:ATPase subunit of ABC transporter with duplicated ATPase domains